jgi:hypothetical protein
MPDAETCFENILISILYEYMSFNICMVTRCQFVDVQYSSPIEHFYVSDIFHLMLHFLVCLE